MPPAVGSARGRTSRYGDSRVPMQVVLVGAPDVPKAGANRTLPLFPFKDIEEAQSVVDPLSCLDGSPAKLL